jgi:hypothetical protein
MVDRYGASTDVCPFACVSKLEITTAPIQNENHINIWRFFFV